MFGYRGPAMIEAEIRTITVVAAVIRDAVGRILLTRRPAGVHMAGLWEFPGGKLLEGEAPAAALERELDEELGVTVLVGEPITFAVHEEPRLRILLLFYSAGITDGKPTPREGQEIEWVAPAELRRYPTPPADAALVEMLSPPRKA
jgi:8-oxo-dGTP diphosphatase